MMANQQGGKYKASFHKNAGQIGLKKEIRDAIPSCQLSGRKLFHRWDRVTDDPVERLLEIWIPASHLGKKIFTSEPNVYIGAPPSGLLLSVGLFHVPSKWCPLHIKALNAKVLKAISYQDGAWLLLVRHLGESKYLAELINGCATCSSNPSKDEATYGTSSSFDLNDQKARLLIYRGGARLWIDALLTNAQGCSTHGQSCVQVVE